MLICLLTGGNFDHLVKFISVRFLYYKVTSFSLVLNKCLGKGILRLHRYPAAPQIPHTPQFWYPTVDLVGNIYFCSVSIMVILFLFFLLYLLTTVPSPSQITYSVIYSGNLSSCVFIL